MNYLIHKNVPKESHIDDYQSKLYLETVYQIIYLVDSRQNLI